MTFSPSKVSEKGSSNSRGDQDYSSTTTTAAFSPQSGYGPSSSRARTTVLMSQKSPLLVATPPTVTRALAFSHPFILPLHKLLGLISWTSGDPWESFLLVSGFWAVVLYGDTVILWAGPVILATAVILAMYSRRFSPLSTRPPPSKHKREPSESSVKHQESLEEIVNTLTEFTFRCNTLLEPFIQLTDTLSIQQTATSASTRSSLVKLLYRMLLVTPFWMIFALSPMQIITTRRIVLFIGTVLLSWYSRPARVSREILWRSQTIRHITSVITGLHLLGSSSSTKPAHNLQKPKSSSSTISSSSTAQTGARFTFTVYENQRRWIGLGWTSSLLTYERAAWTDEHLNPSLPKDEFQLPEVTNHHDISHRATWRWVAGSKWQVEGGDGSDVSGKGGSRRGRGDDNGWIYYDNKWNDGRRGQDGWGRYTRRRKWYRDAEPVELPTSAYVAEDVEDDESNLAESQATLVPPSTTTSSSTSPSKHSTDNPPRFSTDASSVSSRDVNDSTSETLTKRRGLFSRRKSEANSTASGQSSVKSKTSSSSTVRSDEVEDDYYRPGRRYHVEEGDDWGLGDEMKMGLG